MQDLLSQQNAYACKAIHKRKRASQGGVFQKYKTIRRIGYKPNFKEKAVSKEK